jgi:hypothetical protein
MLNVPNFRQNTRPRAAGGPKTMTEWRAPFHGSIFLCAGEDI